MEIITHIVAGALVGLCIGLTGIGGGSLMTPLLLLLGYPAPVAVGTDLLYAAITKAGGLWTHSRAGHVRWRLMLTLAAGSLPMAILTIWLLRTYFGGNTESIAPILTSFLGVMLIVTALVVFFRQRLQAAIASQSQDRHPLERQLPALTLAVGALLGVCVTLSSVGAGAFATAVILLLYTRLSAAQVIGTDIAHAVPLTLVAGMGYLFLGQVDLMLLVGLLIGSLPGVTLGAKLATRAPDGVLRPILGSILLLLGVRLIFFS